jgi:GNAT superfamily N-acetyltransferase
MDIDSCREMELLTREFWPAARVTRLPNGWIIGENDGVTWRANCAFPYGEMTPQAVEDVERFYAAKSLPSAFKMTEAAPAGLDQFLMKRGYEKRMLTYVQTCPLEELNTEQSKLNFEVEILDHLEETWLAKQAVDERYQGPGLAVLRGILGRIPGQKGFAKVSINEETPGVGLGVVHRGWLGLFSIRVDPGSRRKGIGGAISDALLGWGLMRGANQAFLQVEEDNSPAIALYRMRAFKTGYQYWYRIREFT